MFRYFFAPLALGVLLLTNTVQAQTDSSLIDLGRLSVKKQFTQTVTIKGEDLEKYPFTNLAEALNVWLYGVNSNQATLTYVVDGIQVTDVNTYPIQDIEQATLVQNAVTQISGNTAAGQMVLIRLRKNRSKPAGGQVSTQSALTNFSTNPQGTSNDFTWFHNYYLSGFKNYKNTNVSISANYLRDAQRMGRSTNANSSDASSLSVLKRIRLNSYISSQLGDAHQLEFTMGYTPQTLQRGASTASAPAFSRSENMFNTSMSLTSRIIAGLTNQLKTGYNIFSPEKLNRFNIYEGLHYSKQTGNWLLEPSVNLSYQKSWSSFETFQAFGIIIPSLSLSHNGAFNVTGGVDVPIKMAKTGFKNKVGSFISATALPLKLLNERGSNALSLHGSYAYTMQAGANTDNLYSNAIIVGGFASSFLLNSTYSDIKTWNAGGLLKFMNSKLSLEYNFDKRDYLLVHTVTGFWGYSEKWKVNYKLQRASINYDAVIHSTVKWHTGINASINTFSNDYTTTYQVHKLSNYGDNIWTGGWVSRLTAGSFVAGVDLLYDFNRPIGTTATSKTNSISLQNVFAGISVKKQGAKWFEAYATARNQYENSTSIITDKRRFYGIGLQLYF